MPCEIWIRGYGAAPLSSTVSADYRSNLPSSYIEFFYSSPAIAPTSQVTLVSRRANPNQTNNSYDVYFVGTTNNRIVYPNGMWDVYRPPEFFHKGSCPPSALPTPLDPSQRFDCINGNCLPATSYNTQGFYSNQADCIAGCAKNSPCKGECVPQNEIQNLRTSVSKLKDRVCN